MLASLIYTISIADLHEAEMKIVKIHQQRYFGEKLQSLSATSDDQRAQVNLTPFIDDNGVLRVGCRMRRSGIDYGLKHAILEPKPTVKVNCPVVSRKNESLRSWYNTKFGQDSWNLDNWMHLVGQ